MVRVQGGHGQHSTKHCTSSTQKGCSAETAIQGLLRNLAGLLGEHRAEEAQDWRGHKIKWGPQLERDTGLLGEHRAEEAQDWRGHKIKWGPQLERDTG